MRPYFIRSCMFLALSMSGLSCESPHGIAAFNTININTINKKADCRHPGPAGREELELSPHAVDGIVELY